MTIIYNNLISTSSFDKEKLDLKAKNDECIFKRNIIISKENLDKISIDVSIIKFYCNLHDRIIAYTPSILDNPIEEKNDIQKP